MVKGLRPRIMAWGLGCPGVIAAVAELADAPDLGSGGRKAVEVRVLSAAWAKPGLGTCPAPSDEVIRRVEAAPYPR